MVDQKAADLRIGVVTILSSYLIWGFFPLFFKTLSDVPPGEVLTHRILWSLVSMALYVAVTRAGGPVVRAFTTPRTVAALFVSTLLISMNWFVFIYAVEAGKVLESSLGYFLTPLINILVGYLILKEKLRPLQKAAVGLAVLGVATRVAAIGEFPMISLLLGVSFGGYSLVRKLNPLDGVTALTVETALLFPAALGWAIYLGVSGKAAFLTGGSGRDGLLVLSGVVTAVPLVLYGAAIRRLPLSLAGVLQYLVPTMQLLLAVLAFGEPFTLAHFATFALIWAGLALYTFDAARRAT